MLVGRTSEACCLFAVICGLVVIGLCWPYGMFCMSPHIQVLYVCVSKRVTLCCKPAVYGTLPLLRELIQRAPYDVITLEPSDDVREDPLVLPNVLGYIGMPDPRCWAVPNDLKRMVGIVKLARYLKVRCWSGCQPRLKSRWSY